VAGVNRSAGEGGLDTWLLDRNPTNTNVQWTILPRTFCLARSMWRAATKGNMGIPSWKVRWPWMHMLTLQQGPRVQLQVSRCPDHARMMRVWLLACVGAGRLGVRVDAVHPILVTEYIHLFSVRIYYLLSKFKSWAAMAVRAKRQGNSAHRLSFVDHGLETICG
jgi:hypothetical protein